MARMLITISAAFLALIGTGCDGNSATDNGRVSVTNATDQTIQVLYDQEIESFGSCGCSNVGIQARSVTIVAGAKKVIYVDSVLWDGDITVIYNETARNYDLDFDILGLEEVTVRTQDFPTVIQHNDTQDGDPEPVPQPIANG